MADTWKVLSQKQSTEINPMGTGFEQVWVITYQVTSGPSRGTIGSISVPDEDHNPEFLGPEIQAKVDALDSIAGL